MDFDGDNLVYIYKKIKNADSELGPDFIVNILDIETFKTVELTNFTNNIRHLKLFKDGFVYVRDNKFVHYFNVKTLDDQLLFNHELTIVILAVNENLIATVDKGLSIKIMNHQKDSFLFNDVNLMEARSVPKEMQLIRLFEMEYPYFSCISESHFGFTSDFGTVLVNFKTK